jgi:hypothetical protein
LSIDIADATPAAAVRIHRGVNPVTIAGLAAGAERVAADTDVAAGLGVVAGRIRAALAPSAGKLTTSIADIASAPAIICQRGINPMIVVVLAPREKRVTAYFYVFATRLIRAAGRVVPCRSAGFANPKKHDYHDGPQHDRITHLNHLSKSIFTSQSGGFAFCSS